MKGTLFSVDFVEESNGTPRFLEMNTDTYVYQSFVDNHLDWTPFIHLLQSESIDTVSVVYKPDFHVNVVEHLSESLQASASFITTFTRHEEFIYDIYPTPVTDASNKFILRLAYDENAIVDSNYAKGDLAALKLFYEYTASNDCIPFYNSSSDEEINTLQYSLNDDLIPDLVVKDTTSSSNRKTSFYKVGAPDVASTGSAFDSVRILNFLNSVSSSEMVQNYLISTESIDEGISTSIRYYGIVHGTDLNVVHLGEQRVKANFTLPNTAQFNRPDDILTEYRLPSKNFYEFSTSPMIKVNQRGTFETETIVLADNTTVAVTALTTGSIVKAIDIPTLPDESNIASSNYLLWSHAGSTLPSGSAITSSTVQEIASHSINNFLLGEIDISGSDNIYAALSSPLLVYNSSSDEIRFKILPEVDINDDYTIGTNDTLVPINDIKIILLHKNSGSLYDIDVEPVDNYMIGDVSYFSGIFHNRKI